MREEKEGKLKGGKRRKKVKTRKRGRKGEEAKDKSSQSKGIRKRPTKGNLTEKDQDPKKRERKD